MGYFGKFALLHTYLDGTLLAMAQDVNVEYDSKAQQVDTIEQGFSGTSEGSEMVTCTISSAIPLNDFEINPAKFRNRPLHLTFFIAGRAVDIPAIGVKWGVTQATNSPSKMTLTAWCRSDDFR